MEGNYDLYKRIFIQENYTKIEDDVSFDITQVKIRNQEQISSNISVLIKYVVDFLEYQDKIRTLSENIAKTIQVFVDSSKSSLQKANIVPLLFLIFLGIKTENFNTKSNIFRGIIKYFSTPASFIPICVLLTLNITTSMTRFSQMYNSKVDIYKAEKRKTEKLLSSLLPTSVIRKLKKGDAGSGHFHEKCRDFLLSGQMPKPQVFESVSIFFCDIVSFTSICSDSTAHQIIEFLNDLYHMFDDRIDNFDVYKVLELG